jgi:hypothetical protein
MTPFLHFRSWLRTGPRGERLLTATAAAVLLSLVVWASYPSGTATDSLLGGDVTQSTGAVTTGGQATSGTGGSPSSTGATGGSTTGQGVDPGSATGSTGSTGAAPSSTGGGGTSSGTSGVSGPSTGGSTGTTAANACGPLNATDQGVTATTITIGVLIVDLGSANSIVSVPTVADQKASYRVAFDDVNRRGGVRCRKIVPKYYSDNPLDSGSEHATCLQIQQDKVFAVFNNLYTATEQTCIAKAGIPNIWYTPPHTAEVRKYAPYILSWQADFDSLIHQYVFGARSRGWFKGMKKLGILEGSCFPDEKVALVKELKAAGFDPSKAVTFNYGCTGAPALQADQQAALQFKREGVTHVLNIAFTYDKGFSVAADNQQYAPKFAHMEDASATSIESGSSKPGKSFDGTLLISTIETGAANTPGYRYNAPTRNCTKLLASAGLPPAYQDSGTNQLGIGCINAPLFQAMANAAPTLTRRALAVGLSRVGRMELAFPAGPINVTDPRRPTSGDVWRPGVWVSSCNCWHVTDARYRSTY